MTRLLSPAVLAVWAGIVLWLSFSERGSDVAYPRLLALVMLCCALLMGVTALRAAPPASAIEWRIEGLWQLGAAIVLIAVYAMSWNLVGFPVATVAFLLALAWLLGERSMIFLALGPVLATGVLWMVLRGLLHVPLPGGALF